MCRPALIEKLVEMRAPFIVWGVAPETPTYCPLAGRLFAENLVQHLRTGVVTNVKIPAEIVLRESA